MKSCRSYRRGPGRIMALLLAFMLVLSTAPSALAALVVDQRQEVVTNAIAVPAGFRQAQTFTAGLSGRLGQAAFMTGALGDPVELSVAIQGVTAAGQPDGVTLAQQAVTLSAGPARWVTVTFEQRATVAAGSRYALVLAPAQTFAWSIANTSPYAGGQSFTGLDSWWTERGDYTFRTYVVSTNDVPAAAADGFSTEEESPLVVAAPGLLANDSDPDGDRLSVVPGRLPVHGTLSLKADGSFIYTPDKNYFGTDSFTYTAHDGQFASEPVTVTLTVRPVNDGPALAPVANQKAPAGERLSLALAGSDPDGDALTYSLVAGPSGAAVEPDGTFTWTPGPAQAGEHPVTVRVSDGSLTAEASFIVTVEPAPVVSPTGKATGGGWVAIGKGKGHFAFAVSGEGGALRGQGHYSFKGPDGVEYLVRAGELLSLTIEPAAGTMAFTAAASVRGKGGEVQQGYSLTLSYEAAGMRVLVHDPAGALWHEAAGPLGGGQVTLHPADE